MGSKSGATALPCAYHFGLLHVLVDVVRFEELCDMCWGTPLFYFCVGFALSRMISPAEGKMFSKAFSDKRLFAWSGVPGAADCGRAVFESAVRWYRCGRHDILPCRRRLCSGMYHVTNIRLQSPTPLLTRRPAGLIFASWVRVRVECLLPMLFRRFSALFLHNLCLC